MKNLDLIEILQDHLKKTCPFDQTLTICSTQEGVRKVRESIREQSNFMEKQLIQNVQTLDSYLINIIHEDRKIYHPSDFIKDFYNEENKLTNDTEQKFHAAMDVIRMARITLGDGTNNIVKYYDSLYNKNFTVAYRFLIKVFETYTKYKEDNSKVDLEDIKYKILGPHITLPYNIVLMINEAQNYNPLEWMVINKLISMSQYVYMTGNRSL